jgi:Telomere resolvase
MRKWLQTLVDEYLSAVAPLQHLADDRAQAIVWAHRMRQHWAQHGLADLKQQRNLMTDVRNAIKSHLGTDHVALETMNFTVEEWTTINNPIADQVARRNENVVLLDNPDAIVAQAVRLLESREWADIAAGLVVLTGRRSSEIMGSAQFQIKSQWSVRFTGALKRRGEVQRLSFEIPTLTTAERVVKALDKLRAICPTQGLSAQQINQKYAHAVATACDRHFVDLVPKRDGRENLFTHLFRSVYATIATLWFAPTSVDASEYKAAIQGHYAILEEPDSSLRRSLAASRHYNDYKIADPNGNIDGRQGIKLGHGGVQVIDAFNPEFQRKGGARCFADTARVVALSPERDSSALNVSPRLDNLAEEEDTGMDEQEVSQQAIDNAAIELASLPRLEMNEQRSDKASASTKRPNRQRLKQVSVDLDLLKSVAGRFRVEVRSGKGLGYDHALLELLLLLKQRAIGAQDSGESAANQQTVADQAKTLAWLTGRVEQLEAQLQQQQLDKLDKDKKQEAIGETHDHLQTQLEQLQAENHRLNEELQQTLSRLDGIQRFLSGTETKEGAIEDSGAKKTQKPQFQSPTKDATPSLSSIKSGATADPVTKTQIAVDPDALRALQAILDYNDHTATTHADRWAISIPVMKDLLKQLGKATQPKIEAVLRANVEMIQQHHQRHGLGDRHNRVHQGHSISEVITL